MKMGEKTQTALLNAHSVHLDCLSSIGWGHCDAPSSLSRRIAFILNEGFGGVIFFFFGGVVSLQLVWVWQVCSGGFFLAWGQLRDRLAVNGNL